MVSGLCSSSATSLLSGNEPAIQFITLKTRTRSSHKGQDLAGKDPVWSKEDVPVLGPQEKDLVSPWGGSWAFSPLPAWGPSPVGLLTLRAHQHHGHLAGIAEAAKPQEVVVHCLEADLILQAEHKHHCVHPGSKLGGTEQNYQPHLVTGELHTPPHTRKGPGLGRSLTWSSGGPPSSRISSR